MTTQTILAAIPAVQVGRLRSHPSGRGWQILVDPADPDSPVIDAEGEGLTISQAEEVLDRLDNYLKGKVSEHSEFVGERGSD